MRASEFISALVMHFPVRHDSPEREQEWLRSLIPDLRSYEGDVLARAAKHIERTRTDRRFPLPAEIHKVCAAIYDDMRKERLILDPREAAARSNPWSAERMLLARSLIKSEMGREAARDGWILGLWNFAREQARLPEADEIARIKRDVQGFFEAYAVVNRGGTQIDRVLRALGDAMLARRDRLAKTALEK